MGLTRRDFFGLAARLLASMGLDWPSRVVLRYRTVFIHHGTIYIFDLTAPPKMKYTMEVSDG